MLRLKTRDISHDHWYPKAVEHQILVHHDLGKVLLFSGLEPTAFVKHAIFKAAYCWSYSICDDLVVAGERNVTRLKKIFPGHAKPKFSLGKSKLVNKCQLQMQR